MVDKYKEILAPIFKQVAKEMNLDEMEIKSVVYREFGLEEEIPDKK